MIATTDQHTAIALLKLLYSYTSLKCCRFEFVPAESMSRMCEPSANHSNRHWPIFMRIEARGLIIAMRTIKHLPWTTLSVR